ncbi:MAG: alpha/beta fold hydrolase [Planctomycetota bacterium]|nr:alpha/beta fold hydrolase [Planctomycetota bacterium]
MRRRVSKGAAMACAAMLHVTPVALAWDVEQIPTERGDVPLYVPSESVPGEPLPLIVSLHGFTSNGDGHENYFNLRSEIDEQRFLLAVPDGTRNSDGDRFWNGTNFCCDFENADPDDSGFLRGLIETVVERRAVDPGSIHVVGHSNGGFMSYRMACDHADLVASIASLAGATFDDPSDCVPSEPVHVLQIHGTADDVVRYDGGCIIPFFLCYPGAMESVATWADYNGCGGAAEDASPLDLVGGISGAETTRTIFAEGCGSHGTSELWSIQGGDHGPAFNGDFRRELIAWLLEHRRDDPDACVADLDGDGMVAGSDLSLLLAAWGSTSSDRDVDGDGSVGASDLGLLFSAWGACP